MGHPSSTLQRLPEEWRDPTGYISPSPLPKHPNSRNKKVVEKTTKLHDLAKWTSVREERILPFATPPWRRDVPSFGGRLVIAAKASDDKQEKKAAAKVHKIEARKLLASEESLLVYTDGSMRPLHRVRRVGAGAVGFRGGATGGTRVFTQKIGLGSHAEVYDAEMVGLRWGLQGALHFIDSHPNTKHIHLFANNTSAISTIFDPLPKSGQMHCMAITKIPERGQAMNIG